MLKVAEVGIGGISGAHIPAWLEMSDVMLVGLCDIRPERFERWQGKTDARTYTDFDEMLEKEEIDILDITLPTYLHADFAVKALERGIHVVSEKPISLHRNDVARVYAAAEKNGKNFMVAQVLRFWREYIFLKDCIETGRYGKLIDGMMSRIGSIPLWSWDGWMADPARSGMVPFDLHIHDLDFLVYVFGKPEIEHIFHGRDHMHMVYRFGDVPVACEAAWYHAPVPFTASFRFQFEDATVVLEKGELNIYKSDNTIEQLPKEAGGNATINLPATNAYFNELRYFTDCVIAGKPADKIKPEELETVLDTISMINAAKKG